MRFAFQQLVGTSRQFWDAGGPRVKPHANPLSENTLGYLPRLLVLFRALGGADGVDNCVHDYNQKSCSRGVGRC